MEFILSTVLLIGFVFLWVLRKARKPDKRAGHSGLVGAGVLVLVMGLGMLGYAYKAIDEGHIGVKTRRTGNHEFYRARDPGSFWFWTGAFYLSGILSVGGYCGFAYVLTSKR